MVNSQYVISLEDSGAAEKIEQHTVLQSIIGHLLPGAFIFIVFLGLTQLLGQYNLPSPLIFLIALPLALIPAELGTLYYLGWKRNGRLSLQGIVLYREPMKIKHYFWLVPLMFVITVAIFIIVSSFSEPIYQLFDWWPASLSLNIDLVGYSKGILLVTIILWMIGIGIILPTVEEIYFRGYLLPRLSRFGHWAVPLESTLFALYHFWSPWQLVERVLAMLPIIFFTQYKRNIFVVIIVHCAINFIFTIPLLLEILAL